MATKKRKKTTKSKVKRIAVAKKVVTAKTDKKAVVKAKVKTSKPKTNEEWLSYHSTQYHIWHEKKINHAGGGTPHQAAKVQHHADEMTRYKGLLGLLTPPKSETTVKTPETGPGSKSKSKSKSKSGLSDWQKFCQQARKNNSKSFAEIAKEWKKQKRK